MNLARYSALAACLALAACSTPSRRSDDDSMIAHLTDAQREQIDIARAEEDHRGDELASARQAVEHAKAEHSLAKKDLALAEARVDKAEAVAAVAQTGTGTELEAADSSLRTAKAKVIPQREYIQVKKCEVARCEKAALLAERRQELAEANTGLVKARAFVDVDQAEARHVDVARHEANVSDAQKNASLASVELEAATRDCAVAQRTYDDASATSKKE